MITPRATRLHRAANADGFRRAIAGLVAAGQPWDVRDTFVVVPTRAAGDELRRTLETRLLPGTSTALCLPDIGTRADVLDALRSRLVAPPPQLSACERAVLLARAARDARAAGAAPPFAVRPGLVAAMLSLYDALLRQRRTVDRFDEFLTDELSHSDDRGAERLLAQTRFLVEAYRRYDALVEASGADDEHHARDRLIAEPAPSPMRQIVVTVTDRVADPAGLWPSDLDLLTRLPGLERVDVVATEARLAGGWLERVLEVLPEIEECLVPALPAEPPVCLVPSLDAWTFVSRDREEELAASARRLKADRRAGRTSPDTRVALVVKRPLPYLYLAHDVLGRAGIPYEARDSLPLAAEPMAAAVDLVLEWVSSGFTRDTTVAVLRSPHFRFVDEDRDIGGAAIVALDHALADARYLGDLARLEALVTVWAALPDRRRHAHERRALPAARSALAAARTLAPLAAPGHVAGQLSILLDFLTRHLREVDAAADADREARVRAAVLGACDGLAVAYRTHDPDAILEIDALSSTVRQWLEAQTVAPRAGRGGVQIVDAATAVYGEFDQLEVLGLIDQDWPERERRSIFYPAFLLQALGWPEERQRLAGQRAAFVELLSVASKRFALSTVALEDDAIVEPSAFVHDVRAQMPPRQVVALDPAVRVFPWEALALEPVTVDVLGPAAREWAELRIARSPASAAEFHGSAGSWTLPRISVSRLERYLDCPFKFFASEVLGLDEAPKEQEGRSPLERGQFLHELLEKFFAAWTAEGRGAITPSTLDQAHRVFADTAERALATLTDAEAAVERLRLFGTAGVPGIARRVLGLEAERGVVVVERLLEHILDGAFTFRAADGRMRELTLRGKVDRVDLLSDGQFHLIDYKTRMVPNPKRALQLPIYAVCVEQQLQRRGGRSWRLGDASYLSYEGATALVPLARKSADLPTRVAEAQGQFFDALDAVAAGRFPPRPAERSLCATCGFATVCRKDYVSEEAVDG